jgi:protein-arginine kinase activator protein McsA
MPRAAAEPEPMDMHDIAAEQEIADELVMAEEYEEEAEPRDRGRRLTKMKQSMRRRSLSEPLIC